MSPATKGGEQWPMRRVLPTKLIVHAPTALWLCNYLWNGVVLSFWIVAGEGQRQAPSLKGAQPQLPAATLTPLVWPWMGRVGQMVNKHSRSSSGMRKKSDLKRRNYNTSWNSKWSMWLHTGDALVKLSPLFHKGLRGVLTRPRKPTKGRTADPGKKQHPCRRNPEIRSSWSRHGVSGSQTGTGRKTSDCFQHLFTSWQTDPATQHQSRTPVLDYHRRLQQPLTKLGLWAAQQQRRRSGKLDHRKSAHSD